MLGEHAKTNMQPWEGVNDTAAPQHFVSQQHVK